MCKQCWEKMTNIFLVDAENWIMIDKSFRQYIMCDVCSIMKSLLTQIVGMCHVQRNISIVYPFKCSISSGIHIL